MKKLSEYKGEEALDILADLIEPAAEIFADKEFANLIRAKQIPKAAKTAIKGHKRAVLEIMAIMDGQPVEGYAPGVFELPIKLIQILNDPEIMSLFRSAGEMGKDNSTSASDNTEGA